MNDTCTKQILAQLGNKFNRYCIRSQLTKQEILTQAQLTRPTLRRFEKGMGISLLSFIRLLRIINKLDILEPLLARKPSLNSCYITKLTDSDILYSIGFDIYYNRTLSNLSQREFALKAGISIPTLRALETGKEGVSLYTYVKCLNSIGKSKNLVKF